MKKKLIVILAIIAFSFNLNNSKINFYKGSYDNFLRQAKKTNTLIFLEFTADWCAGCKKMQNETFTDPQLIKYMNQNFLSYSVDVDSFDGIEIAQRYNIKAYPSYLILDPKAKKIVGLKGFYPPKYFAAEINKALKDNPIPAHYIAAEFAAY